MCILVKPAQGYFIVISAVKGGLQFNGVVQQLAVGCALGGRHRFRRLGQ